ncbi:hypothetical protein [Pedobacter sp.]
MNKIYFIFYVRPIFSYGNQTFNYYQLHSVELLKEFASGQKDFFPKLADSYLLKLSLEKSTDYKTWKLLANSQDK